LIVRYDDPDDRLAYFPRPDIAIKTPYIHVWCFYNHTYMYSVFIAMSGLGKGYFLLLPDTTVLSGARTF